MDENELRRVASVLIGVIFSDPDTREALTTVASQQDATSLAAAVSEAVSKIVAEDVVVRDSDIPALMQTVRECLKPARDAFQDEDAAALFDTSSGGPIHGLF